MTLNCLYVSEGLLLTTVVTPGVGLGCWALRVFVESPGEWAGKTRLRLGWLQVLQDPLNGHVEAWMCKNKRWGATWVCEWGERAVP